jgi:hypothetical protein
VQQSNRTQVAGVSLVNTCFGDVRVQPVRRTGKVKLTLAALHSNMLLSSFIKQAHDP